MDTHAHVRKSTDASCRHVVVVVPHGDTGLNLYLSGNKAWKKYIVKAFIHRLQLILNWFESQYR